MIQYIKNMFINILTISNITKLMRESLLWEVKSQKKVICILF